MTRELGLDGFNGFSTDVELQLQSYRWPGNVRELRNVVERAVYRHADSPTAIFHLVIDPFESPWRPEPGPLHRGDTARTTRSVKDHNPDETGAVPTDWNAHIRSYEKTLLERALRQNQFHQKQTAAALGLTYDQLRHLLKTHHIARPGRNAN